MLSNAELISQLKAGNVAAVIERLETEEEKFWAHIEAQEKVWEQVHARFGQEEEAAAVEEEEIPF